MKYQRRLYRCNMEIKIQGIQKKYGKKEVLKGIDFTVSSGKCVGVLGGNGCGKSTLLSILAGIQPADAGEFICDGKNLFASPKDRSRLVGYIPQGTPLIEELTAKDNLSLWYSKEAMQSELTDGVLKMLGIDEFLNVAVSKMSGGMKKRLSIGCAVANKPKILLLDEAMAALDISCKQRIFEYVKRHVAEGGICLLVTHDVMELELCDEWYIIKNGKATPFTYEGDPELLIRSF